MLTVVLIASMTACIVGLCIHGISIARRASREANRALQMRRVGSPEDSIQALCIVCNNFQFVEEMRYVDGENGGFKCHPSC
jgi:hypothetical protein